MGARTRQVAAHPFGKHRGKPWRDIPLSYLGWICRADPPFDPDILFCVQTELKRREAEQPSIQPVEELYPRETSNMLDWTNDDEMVKIVEERASLKANIHGAEGRAEQIDLAIKSRLGEHEGAI